MLGWGRALPSLLGPEGGSTPEPTGILVVRTEAHREATPGWQHTWEVLKVSNLIWVILSLLAFESIRGLVKRTGYSSGNMKLWGRV